MRQNERNTTDKSLNFAFTATDLDSIDTQTKHNNSRVCGSQHLCFQCSVVFQASHNTAKPCHEERILVL